MAINPPPLPAETPLVSRESLLMEWFWVQYFTTRETRIEQSPERVVDEVLATQAASIAATPLAIGTAGGFYRLNIYARITRAATVSSSLAIALAWTDGGQAMTQAYAALTANTVTTFQSSVFPVRVDANTSLTYATTYASSGATSMQYSLEVVVERVA